MKYSDKILQNKSFSYNVIGYDSRKKEYFLENVVTKEIRRMPKKEFDVLYKEQKNNNNRSPLK